MIDEVFFRELVFPTAAFYYCRYDDFGLATAAEVRLYEIFVFMFVCEVPDNYCLC